MLKIIVLGDCGVGKTSLVNYFVSNAPKQNNSATTISSDDGTIFESSYQPTIGIRFISTNVGGESVQLWDCSGHNSFRSLRVSHFKEAHGYEYTTEFYRNIVSASTCYSPISPCYSGIRVAFPVCGNHELDR